MATGPLRTTSREEDPQRELSTRPMAIEFKRVQLKMLRIKGLLHQMLDLINNEII
jgi:hypothetical protein